MALWKTLWALVSDCIKTETGDFQPSRPQKQPLALCVLSWPSAWQYKQVSAVSRHMPPQLRMIVCRLVWGQFGIPPRGNMAMGQKPVPPVTSQSPLKWTKMGGAPTPKWYHGF